jgi:hypothetical protein
VIYSVFDLNVQVESTTEDTGPPWFAIPEHPSEKRFKRRRNASCAGLKWNYLVGFALILAAVFFVFKEW